MNSFERVKGVIDMHNHGYPEISFQFQNAHEDDDKMIQHCIDMGMRGIVLKANTFSAVRECYYMQKRFPDFLVMPGHVCNPTSGGLDPFSVEMALQLGAKVIHMPTWAALHDLRLGNFLKGRNLQQYVPTGGEIDVEEYGLTVFEKDTENLTKNAKRIIQLAKQYDVPLFTGHLSPAESMKIFEYSHEIGYKKAVWCHPLCFAVTPEQMEQAIKLGAHIEFIFITMLPAYQMESPKQIADLINRLGAENVIISSDNYDEYSPDTGEMNRLAISVMQSQGITDEQLKTIMIDTPAKLLGLPLWDEVLAERVEAE